MKEGIGPASLFSSLQSFVPAPVPACVPDLYFLQFSFAAWRLCVDILRVYSADHVFKLCKLDANVL